MLPYHEKRNSSALNKKNEFLKSRVHMRSDGNEGGYRLLDRVRRARVLTVFADVD